jgi:ATP adenylyltransferase
VTTSFLYFFARRPTAIIRYGSDREQACKKRASETVVEVLKRLWYLLPMTLKKGTLWQKILHVTENALGAGVLMSIPTDYEFVEDCGISFFVRILSGLRLKDEAKQQQEKESSETGVQANPFLPYENDLFVTDISDTHIAILNKFNVVEHHLLIITRKFEDQEALLTPEDFKALLICMAEYRCLGFYNAGVAAGASQKHKHIQVVPLPLAPEGPQVPIEPLLAKAHFKDGLAIIPEFPFLHVFARIKPEALKVQPDAGEKTFALYCAMLNRVGMASPEKGGITRQSGPYCLLVARDWMLLVPRSHEFFDSISVNSLGFAGALLVRDKEQMERVKNCGPMTVLREVGLPVSGKRG